MLDWSTPGGGRPNHLRIGDVNVTVLVPYVPQGFGGLGALASKWVLSSLRATLQIRPAVRSRHFDLLIAFSPISAVVAQVLWLTRRFKMRNYLVMWDFFPYHHRSIDLIPDGWPFAIAEINSEARPDPSRDGVVRWRCSDLVRMVETKFGVSLSEDTKRRRAPELRANTTALRPCHFPLA